MKQDRLEFLCGMEDLRDTLWKEPQINLSPKSILADSLLELPGPREVKEVVQLVVSEACAEGCCFEVF